MNEAQITVIGWIAADPFYTITGNGTPFLSLRVGCTPRRFDRQSGLWKDGDTLFLTVNCWRQLADNVNASEFRRGHPVVVTGRLRIRQYERDGQYRFSAEIEAGTVGHDLNRGTAGFRPVQRGGAPNDEDRQVAQDAADQWAVSGPLTTPDPGEEKEAGPGEGKDAEPGEGKDAEPGEGKDAEPGEGKDAEPGEGKDFGSGEGRDAGPGEEDKDAEAGGEKAGEEQDAERGEQRGAGRDAGREAPELESEAA
ncbi:single-stranded DNA-binding protein [Spirillospora sp. NPDC047279]|uniref:single-stranded DNA-binding protein n=1 Tax=Spirillospora sp. NPDC047279 TaxID=3155478 RepID=UPI00340D121F